ncbi:MAG TPA: hypothetical protein P5136_00190 [Methanofastidiosum sp.]|nr:hypothetical protein [Methanofastidiosum sp.]
MDYEKIDELVKELISELEKIPSNLNEVNLNAKYNQRFALLYVALKLYDRIYD